MTKTGAKFEIINAFFPFCMNGFLSKCTVLKVDLLQYHQIIYFLQAYMYALFSSEMSHAGAVKGLIIDIYIYTTN